MDCYWPSFERQGLQRNYNFEKAVRDGHPPENNWELYEIRILGIYDTYEEARPKLKIAEQQSDLNTEDEAKENRRIRKRRVVSSSEDSSYEEQVPVKSFPRVTFKASHDSFNTLGTVSSRIVHNRNSRDETYKQIVPTRTDDKKAYKEILPSCKNNDAVEMTLSEPASLPMNDENMTRKILREVTYIKFQLEKLIETSKNHACTCNKDIEDIEEFNATVFPLNSLEDLNLIQQQMLSEDYNNKLILYLSRIGGSRVDEITKLILKRLFSDQLASLFSWEGKKRKRIFHSLPLSDVILKAVRKSPNGTKGTEAEIIISIKNWLRHAPKRYENIRKKMNSESHVLNNHD